MDFVNPYTVIDIPLLDLVRNMGMGIIMALIWSSIIGRSTRLVVDTSQYRPLFLLLIPSMILIITVIKSSIALSLGLVGALSIVRFRTPIKEPEELLYIFVGIAIGLGLGANQILATMIGFVVIVLTMLPSLRDKQQASARIASLVNLSFDKTETDSDFSCEVITGVLDSLDIQYRIKRFSESKERSELVLDCAATPITELSAIRTRLIENGYPVEISITDNARLIT